MAHGMSNRVVAWTFVVSSLFAVVGGAAMEAMAAPGVAGVDANAEQRALIEQLTADKAITVARERLLADEAQEALYDQLKAKDRVLRGAAARAASNGDLVCRVRERSAIDRERCRDEDE